MSSIHFNNFSNFSELSDSLANQWIGLIDSAHNANLPSYFALAGGTTPAPVYRKLDQLLATRANSKTSDGAAANCAIKLSATDERWVDDSDAQSNEGLFKQCLPLSFGKQWQLVSLKNAAKTPEVAVEAISERLNQQIPQDFDAVLLGMGTDGHIASLFPDAPTQHDEYSCLAALHPQTRQSRVSLSMPRLLNTKKIWLVITGSQKKHVLENAENTDLPISRLLREAKCSIDIFWCP